MKPASKSGLGVTRFIELIRPCYNTTAEEETRLLHLFLPALDPEKFALIPEEDRPAVLLKTFRIRAGVEQKSVAKALGRDDSFQATLSAWERRGQNRFNRAFLDGTSVGEFVDIVTPLYRLSAKESEQLLHTLLPGLNPSWLTKQPEDRQLGLYLNALRRRGSSYSYEEMIERLGVNFNWEKRGGIDPSKLPIPFNDLLEKLKESYKLSDREVERITHMVLPALDPKKYALIPEEKKLGELLAAFRKRASLRQDVAGVKIGEIFDAGKPEGEKCGPILFGTMSGWESRVAPPLSQNSGMKEYVSAIMEAYKLSEAERGQLLALTLPPLSPTWLDTQPAKQQAGFMLMAYRQLLGQKRQETAEQLGIKPEKLGEYELSDRLIPSDVFEKAVTYFRSKCGKLFNEGELRSRFESSGIAFGSSSPEENDNERGIYLRELRERSQLPLEEAANRIGVSKGALHNYENGGGFESVRHQQGSRMGAAKFTEAVSEVYKTNPEESTKLLYLLLPALDPKWQERTPLEERLPHLLKAYRLRVGLEISEAGEKMGISPNFASTLGQWEAGNSRPDRVPPSDISIGKFVKDLTATYNLNEKESSQLLEAFFPALNKEWLYWQPQEKQLGLLLKSYRLRGSTLTRVEAEKQLGFSLRAEKTPGDRIAASRIGIPLDEIIARFKTLYDLSEAEALDLKSRISQTQTPPEDSKKDGIPEWSTLKSRRESLGLTLQAAATSMGIEWSELANWERRSPPLNRNNGVKEHILDIIHAYDIPADQRDEWIAMVLPPLSPEWLQTQPEKQRTGFMLMAYRQHTGLIREEFAKHIGTTEQVLGRYESGAAAIPEAIFENAVRFLGQRCPELFDEQQFRDIFSSSQGSSAGSVPPKIKPRRGIDPNSDHIKKREDRPYS